MPVYALRTWRTRPLVEGFCVAGADVGGSANMYQ